MLRDEQVGVESDWTCGANAASAGVASASANHREIDRALRRIAKLRSGLDAEEARWLRRADAQTIWPKLGYVHAHEYLEDVFGYAPRTAQERMRVAQDLGALPQLEAALENGTVCWSVARELTRVAAADTETRWLAAAQGKNLRQVERLVAGHDKGSDPDDAPAPELEMQSLTVRLRPSTIALLRQVRSLLADERGEQLDDDAAYEAMCRRVLDGATAAASSNGPARMIHLGTCRVCQRTTQEGSGTAFDLTAAERELAECDAIICDDASGERAAHAIPPVTRRKVMTRDESRCRVPGCRAARNLDVHHLVHRAHGGGHTTSNLAVLCSGHHRLLHEGVITAAGNADRELTFTRDGRILVDTRLSGPTAVAPASTAPASAAPAHSGASVVPAVTAPVVPLTAAGKTTMSRRQLASSLGDSVAASARSPSATSVAFSASIASNRASRYAQVERRTLATAALQHAGFKATIAKRAVSVAETRVAADAELEPLIREALRHCS